MRRLLFLILIASACLAGGDPLQKDRGKILNCAKCYGLSKEGVRFIVALRMLENGPEGRELGHDNPKANREVFGNPCLREDALGFAQGTVAFQKMCERFVLSDDWRRKQFFRYFTEKYHSGGTGRDRMEQAMNNEAYRKLLISTWGRAGQWMKDNMKPDEMGYCEECYGGTVFH